MEQWKGNKLIAKRFIEDIWGKGDYTLESALIDANLIDHNAMPGAPPGRTGHHQMLTMVRAAFPDMVLKIEHIIAEGDIVVDHWTMTATHKGPMMGTPPTGRRVNLSGMDVLRIKGDKIVEMWHIEDNAGMMMQLGMIPIPGMPA